MDREEYKLLPYWEYLSENEKDIVKNNVISRRVAANEIISNSDAQCLGMIYIISGEIRVSIFSEEGREITLFRVESGDACVATASCIISQITFDTVVTANRDTEILIVPSGIFSKLVADNIYVKAFMYEKETERFSSAMWVMQQILFKKFDVRLAEYLLKECEKNRSTTIQQTQEEIARNVNSAREVVARMLKQFSSDGLITVKRGSLVLENIDELKKIIE